MEPNGALNDFFQRDSRRFMLRRIDLDARTRAALKLLAAFRRKNDKSILGIDFRWWSLFNYFFEFLFCHNLLNILQYKFYHIRHGDDTEVAAW